MSHPHSIALFSILLAATAGAGEIAVQNKPFTVSRTIEARVMPAEGAVPLLIEPKAWADFKLVELPPHGAKVAKGDLLARFDPEGIDRKLDDTRRSLSSGALKLTQAEVDLENLDKTAPHRLDALRREAETAAEEHQYFTQTRRKASEEQAAQTVKRSEQFLENQREELRQLTKMYEADDLTEETEEIILARQKNSVEAAEFALRMEKLNSDRTVGVTLPRQAVEIANRKRDAAIALAKGETDIPRATALKQAEVEDLKIAATREKQALADHQHDRGFFDFKAPADGWLYYGLIEDGRWTTGDAAKALARGNRPAVGRPFATFVPASTGLALVGFVDDATARSLKTGLAGTAMLAGREDLDVPVTVRAVSAVPGIDGSYRVDFEPKWPDGSEPAVGSSSEVRLIAYHQPEAISLPVGALSFGPDGWTVEVKLADGKTERRPVKRGRVSGDKVEIVSGLEPGQVVITPDK